MRIYDTEFVDVLAAARDQGIAPAYFLHVLARDRLTDETTPLGFWSGDDDITTNVEMAGGGTTSRSYYGGCNLVIDGLEYVGDLTDNPVSISMSQIADAVQEVIRGLDVRLAYCEIHATSWNGSALVTRPQLLWVGVVDEATILTAAAGGEGAASLTIRSELMAQLTATNPAKSSDAHQRRRLADDRFCEYASTVTSRKVQWYKE
jgi:hypothetical protein